FGDPNQCNYGFGLNLAITFSDPSTWPKDRTQMPPDTHTFQVFTVHVGAQESFAPGLPQFAPHRYPENQLVWGRGDLAPDLLGDWKIPYLFTGRKNDGGAASMQPAFRFVLMSPTQIGIGVQMNHLHDFETKMVDVSKFGKITGIWQIGPVFSTDRW